jgi:lipopolysaccharide/colanic/teichoic acid biosynthesis glycosyltransferase
VSGPTAAELAALAPRAPVGLALKRAVDALGAAAGLVVLAPLLLLLALAVRLDDPGPSLFAQPRLGRLARPFRILKFRTMRVNVPDLRLPDGSSYAGGAARDPRVTRLGALLRRSSLDELPQLVNVLRGEMSLVGPRPDQVDQLRFYTRGEWPKLAMRPGITGLAQVRGRNAIDWRSRKRWDRVYVRRWSLGLDAWILWRTIGVVLGARDTQVAAEAPREARHGG